MHFLSMNGLLKLETAKKAIIKLLLGASRSDTSEINEDRIILHDEMASEFALLGSRETKRLDEYSEIKDKNRLYIYI
ncbi:hypothetical protein NC652_000032 [Populus alba x Populus x berolinensis]|nr:hypothetical protein NC652_000032 [Populus alba x Populus x berolinensis]